MNAHSSTAESRLVAALQRGVALVRRPWATMGQALGLAEAEVLGEARRLFDQGIARRFGAVFDSRRLGYGSTLCAADVPGSEIERVAALLLPHPGVTHCYEREGRPNLWFTLTAPAALLEGELRRIEDTLAPYPLVNLPAVRRFKVEVVLDAAAGDVEPVRDESLPDSGDGEVLRVFTDRERSLVRRIQENLPVVTEPFTVVALELGWDPDELLRQLAAWKQTGILRRVGFILRHREAGFVANGMCVWPVAEVDVPRAGRILAAAPEVTHCYERPSSPVIPFNLYAMIHAREQASARDIFRRLSQEASLTGGRMLISVREFKKSSPVFFLEQDGSKGFTPP